MILGIGNDLECIDRVKQMLVKLPKTATKILTPAELTVFLELSPKRQGEFLAGRFSAKEAYSKAVGTGIGQTVSFLDIEILNDTLGRPYFSHSRARDKKIRRKQNLQAAGFARCARRRTGDLLGLRYLQQQGGKCEFFVTAIFWRERCEPSF